MTKDTQNELDLGSGYSQKEPDFGSGDTQNELDLGSGENELDFKGQYDFLKVF